MKNLDEVRTKIIAAAEKNFSILGFEKTTLDDIARDMGKCKTSVYYHFKNKHDIFKSVMEKEFDEARKHLADLVQSHLGSRQEQMRDYLRSRIREMQTMKAYSRFASSRFAHTQNPVSNAVSTARMSFDNWENSYFRKTLSDGIEDGFFPAYLSPDIFAASMVNILKALEIQFFNSENRNEALSTYEGMIELMVR